MTEACPDMDACAQAAAASNAGGQGAGGAAPGAAGPAEMDLATLLATFPQEVREEVLLSDDAVLSSLPPALLAEAQALRDRSMRFMSGMGHGLAGRHVHHIPRAELPFGRGDAQVSSHPLLPPCTQSEHQVHVWHGLGPCNLPRPEVFQWMRQNSGQHSRSLASAGDNTIERLQDKTSFGLTMWNAVLGDILYQSLSA